MAYLELDTVDGELKCPPKKLQHRDNFMNVRLISLMVIMGLLLIIVTVNHLKSFANRRYWLQFYDSNVLVQAVMENNISMVQRIIDKGASVNKEDYTGMPPIVMACFTYLPDTNIISLLLNSGANPNVREGSVGTTPLLCLAAGGGSEPIKPCYNDAMRMILNAGGNPNLSYSIGCTPLMLAAEYGHMKQIELLLQYGADVSLVDNNGKSAIDYARESRHLSESNRNVVLERLLCHKETAVFSSSTNQLRGPCVPVQALSDTDISSHSTHQ